MCQNYQNICWYQGYRSPINGLHCLWSKIAIVSTRHLQCDRWRSSRVYFHKNVYTSKLEPIGMWKAFALRGGTEILWQEKKSYSNIEVPVTFSGTKPFLNNDYKKSCKPSPLSGSALYQNILNWKGYETRKTPLLCFC